MHDDLLPGILGEIADVAGIPAALAIADEVGGTRINIPARAGDDHWLVKTVGREAAETVELDSEQAVAETVLTTGESGRAPAGADAPETAGASGQYFDTNCKPTRFHASILDNNNQAAVIRVISDGLGG